MIYKIHSVTNGETVFARIDDDGKCRLTCIAEHPPFQEYLKNGGELQDADGVVMTDAQEFVRGLP